jgi:SAM-dependent methyltransferase
LTSRQVDYDRIAPSYDRRFSSGSGLRTTAAALIALAGELDAQRVMEAGCGTGYWLEALRPAGRHLYGLDLAAAMLQRARQREGPLSLVQARAGQIAFRDGDFDLVFCVNAIHHFQQKRAFVAEARRLLRPGGALAVFGNDPRARRTEWYIYDYFEGTLDTDLARFPSWGTVHDWMVAAGFERTSWQIVERICDHKIGPAVLDDPFLQKNACSQLALLSDEEYAAGLRRIEAALARAEEAGETLIFPTEFHTAMLVGWAPGA